MWKRGKSGVSPIIHLNNRRGQKRIRPQGTELAEERAAKEGLQRRRVYIDNGRATPKFFPSWVFNGLWEFGRFGWVTGHGGPQL